MAKARIYSKGYVLILVGPGKYKAEHRIVAEGLIGRTLRQGEVVHHLNGVRDDNRPDNLMVMTDRVHLAHHRPHLPHRGRPKQQGTPVNIPTSKIEEMAKLTTRSLQIAMK
ncbi:MAG: HNH endonuclease signature motif containing protein, partial [Dehalococcoidia bacterium]|nr:HNH endonuclease signature motif containing protein [Dehalococcoidia bacterium]